MSSNSHVTGYSIGPEMDPSDGYSLEIDRTEKGGVLSVTVWLIFRAQRKNVIQPTIVDQAIGESSSAVISDLYRRIDLYRAICRYANIGGDLSGALNFIGSILDQCGGVISTAPYRYMFSAQVEGDYEHYFVREEENRLTDDLLIWSENLTVEVGSASTYLEQLKAVNADDSSVQHFIGVEAEKQNLLCDHSVHRDTDRP